MRVPVIAASMLKFGDLWEKGINNLVGECGKKGIEDAGISFSEIDSIYLSNAFSSKTNGMSSLNSIAFEELGINNSVCINAGDASGAAAIKEAAKSIISGESKIAMVLGAEKITDFRSNDVLALSSEFLSQEESFMGATVQSQFAIMTNRYLHDFKMKPKDLSFIPSKNHKNALGNEYAQYRLELKEEKINSSPMMSYPIRMLDCASYCDGAAAIIMCSEDAAKRFSKKIKGYLLASSLSTDFLSLSKRNSITSIESTARSAKLAFKAAGISPNEIGLMELHDIVPIAEIIAVEDLGFAKKGTGLKFIMSNSKKINLSGGLKACGHAIGATGVRQAVDIVNRLKTNKLKYGLSQTLSGTGGTSVVNIFGAN